MYTKNYGLLSKLQPCDAILADHGFTIVHAARVYCAEVKIPPFTKGKKQLSKIGVDKARQSSKVCIHMERVIGLVRQKFSKLQSTLPINMIKTDSDDDISAVDKAVIICRGLSNFCDSEIPFRNYIILHVFNIITISLVIYLSLIRYLFLFCPCFLISIHDTEDKNIYPLVHLLVLFSNKNNGTIL